jgi:hypothetical protein
MALVHISLPDAYYAQLIREMDAENRGLSKDEPKRSVHETAKRILIETLEKMEKKA